MRNALHSQLTDQATARNRRRVAEILELRAHLREVESEALKG